MRGIEGWGSIGGAPEVGLDHVATLDLDQGPLVADLLRHRELADQELHLQRGELRDRLLLLDVVARPLSGDHEVEVSRSAGNFEF